MSIAVTDAPVVAVRGRHSEGQATVGTADQAGVVVLAVARSTAGDLADDRPGAPALPHARSRDPVDLHVRLDLVAVES